MALRDKIAANAQPYLQPGESIQGVVSGQTLSAYWALLAVLPYVLINRYRTIVATDRRILVFNAGPMSSVKAKEVVAELPRNHRLGPWSGNVWYRHDMGGAAVRIHRRFKKDIEAIDGVGMMPPMGQPPMGQPPMGQPPASPPPMPPPPMPPPLAR
ncbi:MAG: hypothetical protein L0H31_17005 [Nocardioidaceae bacterium]|nr:hypothetical protein [Nocardioidaceae bacterium]